MPQETTEILFEELVKNQDDLSLFLDLYDGYNDFLRKLTSEFYETALWPGHQARVKAHNQAHPQSQLQPKLAHRSCLVEIGKWIPLLSVVAPGIWPDGLEVGLAGDGSGGIGKIYTQIVLNPVGKQEQAALTRFSAQRPFLLDEAKQRFPSLTIGSNEDAVWCFYDPPYSNLNTREGILLMAQDVTAIKKGEKPSQEGSLSGRYIEDLLTMSELANQAFFEPV